MRFSESLTTPDENLPQEGSGNECGETADAETPLPSQETQLDSGGAVKRSRVRPLLVPSDSTTTKQTVDDDKLRRKQMKKDLNQLNRCMARTGAAAMVASASMLGSQRDNISQMDSESRFRKQMPRVDHYASTLATLAAGGFFEDSVSTMLPYHSRLLDTESETCSVRSRRDSETVSLASVDCSGDSDSKYSVDSRASQTSDRSAASFRRHRRWRMQTELRGMHCYFQRVEETEKLDGQLNIPGCLDRISRLRQRRPKASDYRPQCRGERRFAKAPIPTPQSGKSVLSFSSAGIALATFTLSHLLQKAEDVKSTGWDAWLQITASFAKVGAALGGPPRRFVANQAMYDEGIWSVLKHAVSRNLERRQDARLILLCALSMITGVMCACASLVLLILSFMVVPQPQEPPTRVPGDTGDATGGRENEEASQAFHSQATLNVGDPKALVRVLIVMFISLSAGQGLALYHPIRDALLCSF